MTGGIINELTKEPDGVVLRIHGVGPLRRRVMMIRILPTNYRLKPGDLVWWDEGCLRWEGKASHPFVRVNLDEAPVESKLQPTDKTFWHV